LPLEVVIVIIPASLRLWLRATSRLGDNNLIDLQNGYRSVGGQSNSPLLGLQMVVHAHFFGWGELAFHDIDTEGRSVNISTQKLRGDCILVQTSIVHQSVGDNLERLSVLGVRVLREGFDLSGLFLKLVGQIGFGRTRTTQELRI